MHRDKKERDAHKDRDNERHAHRDRDRDGERGERPTKMEGKGDTCTEIRRRDTHTETEKTQREEEGRRERQDVLHALRAAHKSPALSFPKDFLMGCNMTFNS